MISAYQLAGQKIAKQEMKIESESGLELDLELGTELVSESGLESEPELRLKSESESKSKSVLEKENDVDDVVNYSVNGVDSGKKSASNRKSKISSQTLFEKVQSTYKDGLSDGLLQHWAYDYTPDKTGERDFMRLDVVRGSDRGSDIGSVEDINQLLSTSTFLSMSIPNPSLPPPSSLPLPLPPRPPVSNSHDKLKSKTKSNSDSSSNSINGGGGGSGSGSGSNENDKRRLLTVLVDNAVKILSAEHDLDLDLDLNSSINSSILNTIESGTERVSESKRENESEIDGIAIGSSSSIGSGTNNPLGTVDPVTKSSTLTPLLTNRPPRVLDLHECPLSVAIAAIDYELQSIYLEHDRGLEEMIQSGSGSGSGLEAGGERVGEIEIEKVMEMELVTGIDVKSDLVAGSGSGRRSSRHNRQRMGQEQVIQQNEVINQGQGVSASVGAETMINDSGDKEEGEDSTTSTSTSICEYDLHIITGRGRHINSKGTRGVLMTEIRAYLLNNYGLNAVKMKGNDGCFILSKLSLNKWIMKMNTL